MPTNKVTLRSTTEFMSDYVPSYQPIYPLLLGKSQAYSEDVGTVDFRRLTTIGDVRLRHYTPKDTELRQIAVGEGKKSFRKYFLANQYIQSALQEREGIEDIVAEVLDEHQKQADELMLFGEGTSAGNVINNGLYWSADANYSLDGSVAISTATENGLLDMHAAIMADVTRANASAGRKLILFYGDEVINRVGSLYSAAPTPFRRVLTESLGGNYSIAEMPTDVTPATSYGWIVVNLDRVKLHYVLLPTLRDQGVNDEKMYAWFNFLMGSMMVEVLAKNAVIRQPVTFTA